MNTRRSHRGSVTRGAKATTGMFLMLAALSVPTIPGAVAEADLIVYIDDTDSFANGPAHIGLNLDALTPPSAIQLQVLFNPAKLTFRSAVAGQSVLASGKQIAAAVSPFVPGVLTVVISGTSGTGVTSVLSNGNLATLTFSVYAGAVAGDNIPVQGGLITASTPGAVFIPSAISDGTVIIGQCSAPSTPQGLTATKGTFSDRIRITWNPAARASDYVLYRNTSNNRTTASTIGIVQWNTQYDDFTAAALITGSSSGGCSGSNGSPGGIAQYYYWVVARNSCGNSGSSAAAQGYRASQKAATGVIAPSALPGAHDRVQPCDALAIRIQSDNPVDPGSVWGTVDAEGMEDSSVEWIPDSGLQTAGWVVYRPAGQWFPGEVVVFTASAQTMDGEPVGPIAQLFEVAEEPDACADAAPCAVAADDSALTPSPSGNGNVYRILPEAPSGEPFAVFLPLPEGVSASGVSIYYFVTGYGGGQWYPGEQVAGWMVSGAARQAVQDGVPGLAFEVRYGGAVCLDIEPEVSSAGDGAPFSQVAGNGLLMFLPAALFILRRGRTSPANH